MSGPIPADPTHIAWTDLDRSPWPEWVTEFRPHQIEAVERIVAHFEDGADVVFLDAPTGAGKTLIAEMVRRWLSTSALYICHSLGLQDQFLNDFPYARVLKGRANYRPQRPGDSRGTPPELIPTCADCTATPTSPCLWCDSAKDCPYQQQKGMAIESQLTVLNTAYFLGETSNRHTAFGQPGGDGEAEPPRDLVVVDECDTLESSLMGSVELYLGDRMLRDLGTRAPVKGAHAATVEKWLHHEVIPALMDAAGGLKGRSDVRSIRSRTRYGRIVEAIRAVRMDGNWVRDYRTDDSFLLKPVVVNQMGEQRIWRHSNRWLMMSATVISVDEMCDSLGISEDDHDVRLVRVPMTFPVENRKVNLVNVARVNAKNKVETWPKVVEGCVNIVRNHPGEKVLIHAVSYALAQAITEGIRAAKYAGAIPDSASLFTYARAADREREVSRFKKAHQGVMIAPSLDRGFDFAGDDCRVQVVAKAPFPNMGDRQVSGRLHSPGGQRWFDVQTVRDLVQMTGRGVRNKDDWCVTYVLDGAVNQLVKKSGDLFPDWWLEATETSGDFRWVKDSTKRRPEVQPAPVPSSDPAPTIEPASPITRTVHIWNDPLSLTRVLQIREPGKVHEVRFLPLEDPWVKLGELPNDLLADVMAAVTDGSIRLPEVA